MTYSRDLMNDLSTLKSASLISDPHATVWSAGVLQRKPDMQTTAKEVTFRVADCDNGYVIFASRGSKTVTRVATSETLLAEINACMVSLKME